MRIQQVDLSIRIVSPTNTKGFAWKNFLDSSKEPLVQTLKAVVAACTSLEQVFLVMRNYVPVSAASKYCTEYRITAFQASVIVVDRLPDGAEESIKIERDLYYN